MLRGNSQLALSGMEQVFSVFQHQSRWLEQNKADSDVMGEYQLRNIPLLPAIRIEPFMDRQGFTEYTQHYTHGFEASAHTHRLFISDNLRDKEAWMWLRRLSLLPQLLLDCFQSLWQLALTSWSLSDRQEVPDALGLHTQVGVQGDEGGAYQTLLHVTLHTHWGGRKVIEKMWQDIRYYCNMPSWQCGHLWIQLRSDCNVFWIE